MHHTHFSRRGAIAHAAMASLCLILIILLAPLTIVLAETSISSQQTEPVQSTEGPSPIFPDGYPNPGITDQADPAQFLAQVHPWDDHNGLRIEARPGIHSDHGAIGSVRLIDTHTGDTWAHLNSERRNDLFGYATTWLGDIDGDTWPDLAIAIPNAADPDALDRRGVVRIVSGFDASTIRTIEGEPGEFFGAQLVALQEPGAAATVLCVVCSSPSGDDEIVYEERCYDIATGDLLDTSDAAFDIQQRRNHANRLHGGIRGDLNSDFFLDLNDLQIVVDALGESLEPGADTAMQNDELLALGLVADVNQDTLVNDDDLAALTAILQAPRARNEPIEFTPSDPRLPPGCIWPCGLIDDGSGGPPPGGGDPPPGGGTPPGPYTVPGNVEWSFNLCTVDENDNGIPDCEDCASPAYQGNPDCCDPDNEGLVEIHLSGAVVDVEGTTCEDPDFEIGVLLANTLDGEWDGIPDYLDGYASEGGIEIDEDCPQCQFANLVIETCDSDREFVISSSDDIRLWRRTFGAT